MPGPGGPGGGRPHGGPGFGGPHGGPGGPGFGGPHGGPRPRPPFPGYGRRPYRGGGCLGCLLPVLGTIAVFVAALSFIIF